MLKDTIKEELLNKIHKKKEYKLKKFTIIPPVIKVL